MTEPDTSGESLISLAGRSIHRLRVSENSWKKFCFGNGKAPGIYDVSEHKSSLLLGSLTSLKKTISASPSRRQRIAGKFLLAWNPCFPISGIFTAEIPALSICGKCSTARAPEFRPMKRKIVSRVFSYNPVHPFVDALNFPLLRFRFCGMLCKKEVFIC